MQNRMNLSIFLIAIIGLAIISNAFASTTITDDNMLIFAVTQNGNGVSAKLNLKLIEGHGDVWSKIDSYVGISTQITEKTVVELAQKYNASADKYDYKYGIESKAQSVDGPSAGLPMALITISMLSGKNLPDYVSATGTISSEGKVGRVGGIFEKTKEAARNGVKLFLIPLSDTEIVIKDTNEVIKVDIREYAKKNLGINVVGVDNIDSALEIAYSDLDDINYSTNVTNTEKLIYEPPLSDDINNTKPIRDFIESYLRDLSDKASEAKEKLNNSALENNEVLNYLFERLSYSEELLKDANRASEKNYLYSAANYLFLSSIGMQTVIDVAQNPELIDDKSKLAMRAELELSSLKTYIDDFNYITYEDFEWSIASKQRALWASKYLEEIVAQGAISKSNSTIDEKAENIMLVEKYETAKEWINISKTFSSKIENKRVALDNESYKDSAKELLKELELAESKLSKDELDEVEKYIYSARDSAKRGLYIVSIYESASALAILNSGIEMKNKSYAEIEELYNSKLEKYYEDDFNSFIWPSLYLAHSSYQYSAAKFYSENLRVSEAQGSLNSAYKLLSLAYNNKQTAMEIEDKKEEIKYIVVTNNTIQNPSSVGYELIIVLILLISIIGMVAYLLYRKFEKSSVYNSNMSAANHQIYKVKSLMVDLDQSYVNGKLDQKKYEDMRKRYKEELKDLETKKERFMEILSDIELLESELIYLRNKLSNAASLFKKGVLSEEDYYAKIKEYKRDISNIEYNLDSDRKRIKKDAKKK